MSLKKLSSIGIGAKEVGHHLISGMLATGFVYLLTEFVHIAKSQLGLLAGVFTAGSLLAWGVAYITRQKVKTELSSILQAEYEKKSEALILANTSTFENRTEDHHLFAHYARDLAIKLTGDYKPTKTLKVNIPKDLQKEELRKMLEQVYKTFKHLVHPNVKLFATIRELRGEKYHTLLRVGDMDNEHRQNNTHPLELDDLLVSALTHEFKNDECVLPTGTSDPRWKYPDPDGVHKSVLLGAVFSKRWSNKKQKFIAVRLEWILSIAANDGNALKPSHRPLMRCFNDVCGLIVNVALRHQLQEERKSPTAPMSEGHDTWD